MFLLAARGRNYRFYKTSDLVLCRILQRRELTSVEGAQCAEEISQTARRLTAESSARGLIFDIRQAPPVFGPKTEAALRGMFELLAKSRVSIRCVVCENPLQEMQYGRLLREAAPQRHEVVRTFELACAGLGTARGLEEPPSEE